MGFLDMQTVFVSYVATAALCAGAVGMLRRQNRVLYPEIRLWLAFYVTQFTALLLIALRGSIPDLLSMVVANVLVLAGMMALYQGLGRFVGASTPQAFNYVVLVVFSVIHSYLTFVNPSLALRNVNLSIAGTLIVVQIVWLLLRRAGSEFRPGSTAVGGVLLLTSLAYIARAFFDLTGGGGNDLFESGPIDVGIILTHQVLLIALTLSLFFLLSSRLIATLEDDFEALEAAEAAVRLSEAKFTTAFHTSPDAVNINRLSDGLYLEVNEGFTQLTGYTREDVGGKTSNDIEIWSDPADRERLVAGLRSGGEVHNLEARFVRKDGSVTTALMSARVVEIDGEKCILSVTRDISERKHAEESLASNNRELELQNDELARLNAQKNQFLGMAAHDLRNPVNLVLNYAELLETDTSPSLAPEHREYVETISRTSKRMSRLIDSFLDVSLIDAGRFVLDVAPISVPRLLESACRAVEPLALNRDVSIHMQAEKGLAHRLGDEPKLEQVLVNLLSNGIHASVPGASVEVGCRKEGDDLFFWVTDQGTGMDAGAIDRLFSAFERPQARRSDGTRSIGLGLLIAQKIVVAHGGHMVVESEPGQGSTFGFTLPADVPGASG